MDQSKEIARPTQLEVEEYKSCRELLLKNIEIIERSEIYAVGAVAASAAFTIASPIKMIEWGACLIPSLISVLGYVRWRGIDKTIDKINNYLLTVEAANVGLGWTKSYRDQNKNKELKKSRQWFWYILIAFSLIFAFAVWHLAPFGRPEAG